MKLSKNLRKENFAIHWRETDLYLANLQFSGGLDFVPRKSHLVKNARRPAEKQLRFRTRNDVSRLACKEHDAKFCL